MITCGVRIQMRCEWKMLGGGKSGGKTENETLQLTQIADMIERVLVLDECPELVEEDTIDSEREAS